MTDYPRFELVSKFADQVDLLPTRGTKFSAGYDFTVAEDIVVPAYEKQFIFPYETTTPLSFSDVAAFTKKYKCKPTLVPTGVKAYIPENMYLQLSVRSSCPLKAWLILANGVGRL